MNLTHENYFSPEMMMHFMSTSQFKAFEQCEAKALAELRGEYTAEKEAYKEGHYFEACLNGPESEELFLMQNPDMISSRGASKGDLKSNFQRIQGAVEAFKRQPMFMEIVNRSKQQVIVTGEIAGLPFKGCIDFLDADMSSNDTKAMKDFKKVWSDSDGMYVQWYFAYGYHYQAAIYRELTRQMYGQAGHQRLLAVTKEEIPDACGFVFTDEILDNALEIIKEFAPRYDKIKRGEILPQPCGHCDYCRSQKVLHQFDIISEYE